MRKDFMKNIRKGKILNCYALRNKKGMELVQVALLIAIAVALVLIFKTEITDFVNNTFENLNGFN